MGSIPGWGRSLGGENGNTLQYTRLGNHMDRTTWWSTVYRVMRNRIQLKWLSTFTCKHQLTYGMKCNRKPYLTSLSLFPYKAGAPWWLSCKEPACQCRRLWFSSWDRKIPWRRKWQPTSVSLPWECHGQRSLAGYNSWGLRESNMSEHSITITMNLTKRTGICEKEWYKESSNFFLDYFKCFEVFLFFTTGE